MVFGPAGRLASSAPRISGRLSPVANAAQVVRAACPGRRFRGMGINAVGDACQQGNDGDDYENFNECETFAAWGK